MQKCICASCFLFLIALWGCASGGLKADHCEIEVVRLAHWDYEPGRFDVAYEVRGQAGSPGRAWLAGQVAEEQWISGDFVPVGPGPFQTEIDMQLTGRPGSFRALLRVGDKRCDAEAPYPGVK